MPELFSIETNAVRLTWAQRRQKPPAVMPPGEPAVPFGLEIRAPRAQPTVQTTPNAPPYLFEQTDYTLFVQHRAGGNVAVRHADPVLLRGLQQADDGRVVHGVVNFGTQVGFSRFVVLADGQPHVTFRVEVRPSKLDYRADYDALHADVQRIARTLSMAYLRATFRPAQSGQTPPSELEWTTLLRSGITELEQAIRYLAQNPQWSATPADTLTRAERVRHPDALVQRAIRQGRGHGAWQHVPDGAPVRSRLPARPAQYTLDTPEHQWLAHALQRIQHRLATLSEQEQPTSGIRRKYIARELVHLHERVALLLRAAPLREASQRVRAAPTLRLRTAPGYAEAYRVCVRLQRGLNVEGEALSLSLKDLHLLYEYWCFLTVLRVLAEEAGTEQPWQDLVQVRQHGLRVRLRRGQQQRLRIDLGDRRHAVLIYNPRFSGRRYLVPQQPDFLLEVHGPQQVARYILDAKYRLDASPAYRRRYGLPGPPADALNALHRYRDAIRDRRGGIREAVALYPWRDEENQFPNSRHAQALQTIGIGAIPLLPGHTEHLRDWLRRVLEGSQA